MSLLQKDKMINKVSNRQLTKISICKYELYQGEQQTNNKGINKQTTHKRQTNDKPTTTDKNDKNENNEEVIQEDPASKIWEIWKEYKKTEFKFQYKSDKSEGAAKKLLMELSGGDLDLAIRIIEQSMANGWQGLFKLKDNGRNQKTNSGATAEQLASLLAHKLGSDRGQ